MRGTPVPLPKGILQGASVIASVVATIALESSANPGMILGTGTSRASEVRPINGEGVFAVRGAPAYRAESVDPARSSFVECILMRFCRRERFARFDRHLTGAGIRF